MSSHNLGDYEQRHRGLLMLMRPLDVLLYDRWRHEARSGVVTTVPLELRVGYAILGEYARLRGRVLGDPGPDWPIPPDDHPLLFLWSCVHIHRNKMSQFAPLITTAYEELIHD